MDRFQRKTRASARGIVAITLTSSLAVAVFLLCPASSLAQGQRRQLPPPPPPVLPPTAPPAQPKVLPQGPTVPSQVPGKQGTNGYGSGTGSSQDPFNLGGSSGYGGGGFQGGNSPFGYVGGMPPSTLPVVKKKTVFTWPADLVAKWSFEENVEWTDGTEITFRVKQFNLRKDGSCDYRFKSLTTDGQSNASESQGTWAYDADRGVIVMTRKVGDPKKPLVVLQSFAVDRSITGDVSIRLTETAYLTGPGEVNYGKDDESYRKLGSPDAPLPQNRR
jgi:hypothetical protein